MPSSFCRYEEPNDKSRAAHRASRLALLLSALILFLLPLFPALAQNGKDASGQPGTALGTPLERRILKILGEDPARQAYWGVEVVSLGSGERLVSINSDKRFVPASTAKLFPAAVALARLGPNFIYQTAVQTPAPITSDGRVQGDVFLVGRGDPNLSGRVLPYNGPTERIRPPTLAFDGLAAQLAQKDIRVIEGDIVADDTYFVSQRYGRGWTVDDLQWGYGAPVAALSLNDNVIVFRIHPAARAGEPAVIEMEPFTARFQLKNRIATVARYSKTAPDRRLTIDRAPGSTDVQFWGEIRLNSPEWTGALAMDNPPWVAGEVFRDALQRNGIEVRGTVRVRERHPAEVPDLLRGALNEKAQPVTVLASRDSLPLAESLKVTLKVSQNLHAEMLLRTLGRELRQLGSVEAGLAAIGEFLKEKGISEDSVLLRDGSGLSRQSLVTPSALTSLLRVMYGSPHRDVWLDLLPLAGTDGSLLNRLQGGSVMGRVRAKTGGLAGVAALAGYAPNANGDMLAFAILINHHALSAGPATGLIDRIVQEIASSR
jgi:serine-type D-Ala-D-Ala carboxypeptidase/endopeptidase (penicillin-binding protein 4)